MGGSKAGFLHILQPQNRDYSRENWPTHKSDVVGLGELVKTYVLFGDPDLRVGKPPASLAQVQ